MGANLRPVCDFDRMGVHQGNITMRDNRLAIIRKCDGDQLVFAKVVAGS